MKSKALPLKIAIIVLALAGTGLALELTRVYVMVRIDPGFETGCAVNETVNCVTVAESEYSDYFGLPVSVYGLGGFAALLIAAAFSIRGSEETGSLALVMMLLMGAWSVAVSIALFVISKALIGAYCPYCLAVYGVSILVMALVAVIANLESPLLKSFRKAFSAEAGAYWGKAFPALAVPLLAASVIMSGYLALYGDIGPVIPKGPGGIPAGVTGDGHHWIGAAEPVLVIEEFTDYECPHCKRAHSHMREAVAEHKDELRLIHRHLPLDNKCHPMVKTVFHQNACRMSAFAVCAGEQGRFWEMNDYLFGLEKEAGMPSALDACAATGLDAEDFRACLETPATREAIDADILESIGLNVFATPTAVIDGHTMPPPDGEELEEMLERARAGEPVVVEKTPEPDEAPAPGEKDPSMAGENGDAEDDGGG